MRKSTILFVVLVLLLSLPVVAHAQSAVTFQSLEIQLWPDYDQPSVLVIYDFTVTPETTVPAEVGLNLPVGSQLLAVAKDESGGLVNVDYKTAQQSDGTKTITLSVVDQSLYHIEYYMPYTRTGQTRSFEFAWADNYAVQSLLMRIQEPVGATNLVTDPAMTKSGPAQDGFSYYTSNMTDTKAGDKITFKASYDKADDKLSADTLGVQPVQPLDQPASGQSSFSNLLPWILGGLGVLLIVGGGAWYWMSGNTSNKSTKSRKRHSYKDEEDDDAEESGDGQTYCTKCGKRAQPADRFCRACGTRIK